MLLECQENNCEMVVEYGLSSCQDRKCGSVAAGSWEAVLLWEYSAETVMEMVEDGLV